MHCAAGEVMVTVAGAGTEIGESTPAISALLKFPTEVATDALGNIFVLEADQYRIRKIDAATGLITTVAGSGKRGNSPDGVPALSAKMKAWRNISVDANGNIY